MNSRAATESTMSDAKQAILQRLQKAPRPDIADIDEGAAESHAWDLEEKIRRFTQRMTAVRAEVIETGYADWPAMLKEVCERKGLGNLLYSPGSAWGDAIRQQPPVAQLLEYDREIEEWKAELFRDVEAAVTTTRGGIAETGTLILWPDADEPRLMSLVPPLHVAILEARELYSTFAEAVAQMPWKQQMPSNALLISGPSKSADIEQTLAYGVHGPKELLVLLVRD
jgi:L-lactate dehydrogenase complex protein LldG